VALFVGGLVLLIAAGVAYRFIPGRHTEHVPAPGDHGAQVAVEV
jgi:hypothetical protein